MIFDPASASHLKPWLVRTLEPICDAEPGALADYILALLKHNVPEGEMRQELAVQLDEFLEKECPSFIDTLFTVLRTKSYLPYSAHSPPSTSFTPKPIDTGIPIPLDGLLSPPVPSPHEQGLKRSIDHDERDGRPTKGPRLSTEGQFPRFANGHNGRLENHRPTGNWGGRVERPSPGGYREGVDMFGGAMGMAGMNGSVQMTSRRPQVYLPPDQKRGICRDYHNNGYCARGAMCKYSHGDDAVVPGQLYPMGSTMAGVGLPFMPMFPGAGMPFGAGPGVAYDPHEARMDMRPTGRPHQRAPLLPRIQQEDGSQSVHSTRASGELPVIQDLTPNILPDSDKDQTQTQVQQSHPPSSHQPSQQDHPESVEQIGYDGERDGVQNGVSGLPYMNAPMDTEVNHPMEMRPPRSHNNGFRSAGRGLGRGRGTFGGEIHNFRPERRTDKTLVVEKIPEDKLTLERVNEWFKRFGTVTNVAIDCSNAKALISFSNHEEAHAAWKSEDAVFNNRFVKVFWHRPMEGHGQVGSRMLAASAPLVANISAKESTVRPAAPTSSGSSLAPERKPSTPTASVLAAKQQLLEQQIAEQKSLMTSLDAASSDEKKTIMARLRKLGEEMNPIAASSQASSSTAPAKKPSSSSLKGEDREKKERERLDKELEMHSATVVVDVEESTEALKAKLERLKAEAASLGIAETEPSFGGSYRPYRGRGRGGRGFHRGALRGGPPPRGSMKLDNRPKKLLVKGIRRENLQALRDWFETTGQVESLETAESGDVIIAFKSRAAAEQGMSKGTNVPIIGSVSISWYTGKPVNPGAASSSATPRTTSADASDVHMTEPARPSSPEQSTINPSSALEEEVVASGWGGDGDGEDGMGML